MNHLDMVRVADDITIRRGGSNIGVIEAGSIGSVVYEHPNAYDIEFNIDSGILLHTIHEDFLELYVARKAVA